jgi:uncharacterized protein YjbJ (UPF0337 family)
METQELYKQKMAAQLEVWSAKLHVLQAKAGKASADAKLEIHGQADKLEALKTSAQAQLDKLQSGAADSWDTVKTDVSHKWDQVSGEIEAIWEKLH